LADRQKARKAGKAAILKVQPGNPNELLVVCIFAIDLWLAHLSAHAP